MRDWFGIPRSEVLLSNTRETNIDDHNFWCRIKKCTLKEHYFSKNALCKCIFIIFARKMTEYGKVV